MRPAIRMLPVLVLLCAAVVACQRSSPRPAPREPFPNSEFTLVEGLRLRVIPAAGHCPMETHPAEFLAILLPFLGEAGEAKRP